MTQTALLLHQLLNGRDPNLASISDPTIPRKPNGTAIAVNCLWCASITTSLCSTAYVMPLKWWLTEYDGGANPVGGLLRACRRHMRFKAFERLNAHALVAFLPTFLLQSINLFFADDVIYSWQLNKIMMAVFAITGGAFWIAYISLFILPSVKNLSLFYYPASIFYQPSFAVGKIGTFIVGAFVRFCCLILRCAAGVVLFPFIQTVSGAGTFYHWYIQTQTTSPEEHRCTRAKGAITLHKPPDDIDTSQKAQLEKRRLRSARTLLA